MCANQFLHVNYLLQYMNRHAVKQFPEGKSFLSIP